MTTVSDVLPPYNDECEIVPALGRQDKILLHVGRWRITGTVSEMGEFRNSLPSINPVDGTPRRLFAGQRAQERYWRFNVLSAPLFSGVLLVRHQVDPFGHAYYIVSLDLGMNPTRWVANQSTRITQRPFAEWMEVPPDMFAESDPYLGNEVPLVAGDNVVLGMPRDLLKAHPARWDVQLRRYWNGIVDLVERWLQQSADDANCQFQRIGEHINIKEIETHWEFSCDRPLEEMLRLERAVRRVAASSETNWMSISQEAREHIGPLANSSIGAEDNSPRIKMMLERGTSLRIYAKTSRRLRFEVVFVCAEARAAFPTHTATNWATLFIWLERARTLGAEYLSDILPSIRAAQLPPEPGKRSYELVADIFRATSDAAMSQAIVEALIANGRVVNYRGGSMTAVIRRLCSRNILYRLGRQSTDNIYVVTTQYQQALTDLRGEQQVS